MVKLAANLSTLFTELPFLDRFEAAARSGFTGVECQFPYAAPAQAIAEQMQRHGLFMALFNCPPGDLAAGDRGLAALPDRREEARAGIDLALDYARVLNCPRLHLMAGVMPDGWPPEAQATLIDNARYAADAGLAQGVQILLEPLNPIDNPGCFYTTTAQALDIIDKDARPNVRLQYDLYHMDITEGSLAQTLTRQLSRIGHIQIADNPGRGEPGTGRIDYRPLLRHLDEIGYDGWLGCEYRPVSDTVEGLAWAKPYL